MWRSFDLRICRVVGLGANIARGILPRLSRSLATPLYEGISCPLIPVDMACGQAKSNIKNTGRQPSVLKDQGEMFEVCISGVWTYDL